MSFKKSSKPLAIKIGSTASSSIGGGMGGLAKKSPASSKVASVFNQDSDSDEEDMPPEARMRMKNVGRDTITSAGPNSFGKTKHGFVDSAKLFERKMQEAMNDVSNDK